MQLENLTNNKFIVLFFFISFFVLGLLIYKDYGISLDEEFHRNNALFWYSYIKGHLPGFASSIISESESLIINSINKNDDYVGSVPSIQPVPLAILYEFIIDIFNIKETKNIFQYRHLYNFTIFLIGLAFFFKLIKKRFKSNFFSLMGCLFLFFTPRIFSESFYNQQDIFFLSLTIINIFFGLQFLENPNLKNSLIFSLISALTIDTRIIGLVFFFLILFFFFIKSLRNSTYIKENWIFLLIVIPLTYFLIVLFWPYLWSDIFKNTLFAFSELLTYKFSLSNLYFGNLIPSTNIPWHYHLVWIFITTPLSVTLFFFFGIFFILRRFSNRILKIDENLNDIWRGNNELFDVYIMIMFFLPIFLFIKKNLGYDGWRHLYFIYPIILLVSLHGIYYLKIFIKSKSIGTFISFLILLNFTYITYWNLKYHPHQNVYFNPIFKSIFKDNFEMDYWGLSNNDSINYIIKNNDSHPTKVFTLSFSSLEKNKLMLDKIDKSKIIVVNNLKDADFLITNYRNLTKDNFKVDKNKYRKYYEILVDNVPINTIYKKVN